MKNDADQIRNEVAQTYGQRVSGPAGQGGGRDKTLAKELTVTLAGYSPQELATLPAGAVENTFGCGNPLSMAGLAPGNVVIDLGSGAGLDLLLAAEKVGPTGRVIGIDMTDEMIAKANENIRTRQLRNVEVRKGIIEDMPVETASADWIISNCVINLSPEKPRVFREIARVLKPGGQMLISDMMAENLPPEMLGSKTLRDYCVSGAISEKEYLAGLMAAGLTAVEVRHRLIYSAGQIAAGVAEMLRDNAGLAELIERFPNYATMLEGKVWSSKVYARKTTG